MIQMADTPPDTQAWIEHNARALGCTCLVVEHSITPTPQGHIVTLWHVDTCLLFLASRATWN